MECEYCDDDGAIEMDNNGPIVPCPICGGKTMNETIFKEIWALSTEDEYFDMLGSMTPIYHLGDNEGINAFLLGEPSDHEAGFPTYHAFLYFQEKFYRSRRPMTVLMFKFEMEELLSWLEDFIEHASQTSWEAILAILPERSNRDDP
jgi:hypothetical protein